MNTKTSLQADEYSTCTNCDAGSTRDCTSQKDTGRMHSEDKNPKEPVGALEPEVNSDWRSDATGFYE